ncbi:hypothetical protein JR316_0002000 [Psilocybe cubensis]|uniref:Uncharacterized protein n=2 Tax=Psilocybe cubensis TaxID=181762 RepID=A0A8H7Y749_PSICU|nr:hypothetical protein JR316_0002000 [Psilocybe cubensis]KAH9485093.1 hypothetical protein JR316_0002000 [Psilocybe cubensis]
MSPSLSSTFSSLHNAARVVVARAVSSSEAASLGGKKAKTPIIAGSICGGVLFLAWVIGFAIYFRKRINRKKRNRLIAQGKATPREKDLDIPTEKIVIPPDPAVLLGRAKPGENVFPERQHSKDGHHHHLPWSTPSRHGSHSTTNGSTPNRTPGLVESSIMSNKLVSSPRPQDDDIVDTMTVPSNV